MFKLLKILLSVLITLIKYIFIAIAHFLLVLLFICMVWNIASGDIFK